MGWLDQEYELVGGEGNEFKDPEEPSSTGAGGHPCLASQARSRHCVGSNGNTCAMTAQAHLLRGLFIISNPENLAGGNIRQFTGPAGFPGGSLQTQFLSSYQET